MSEARKKRTNVQFQYRENDASTDMCGEDVRNVLEGPGAEEFN